MDKVRFGIIGFGNMGGGHCSYLSKGKIEGAELTAICDIKPAKLEAAKEKYPNVALFDNHMDLLKSGLVDAVIIAVPHYFHTTIGIDALNAGVNIISEKPAGVYTKAVEELIAVAKSKPELTYGMMFNQRTNPMYQKMREMVQGGELGDLYRCVWIITDWFRTQSYYDSGDWRATWSGEGGGVLLNQCPHQLDLWQWIFGMPTRIHAFCHEGKFHNIEVEDDVTAYAEYANGASGVFITTTGEAPGTNRLEITGSLGKLVAEGKTLTFWKNKEDCGKFCHSCEGGFNVPEREKIEFNFENGGPQHEGITQNFTDHLLKGTPLLAEGCEGINGLSISNAMMLSSWKNDWVDLPNDGEEFWAELQKKIANSKVEKKNVEEKIVDLSDTYTSK
ncbi:MAG: Gfo/Idh/MocA family oxidoreductase [Clostridiales bacterium]|nr:Gfo/Idh/MocA family oxidoreductase [Clostridiales bacterium]